MCLLFFADVEDPEIFEGLLNNEKENFKVLFEKVCYERIWALMGVAFWEVSCISLLQAKFQFSS